MIRIFGSLLFIVVLNTCYSQKYEFGLGAGVSHFRGDISPNFNPKQLGIGAQGLFRYQLSKSVTARANVLYTSYNAKDLNTSDVFYKYRAAEASGSILEISAIGEYVFLNQHNRTNQTDFTPYLFAGVGYGIIANKSDQFAATINANSIVLPYGVGLKYRFKGPWSIGAEFGSRYTFTDDMDKRFGSFGNTNLSSPNLSQDKFNFGDTTRKDQYHFTSITLTYTIFNIICPD
jgi:opacity protein-like surface antigen